MYGIYVHVIGQVVASWYITTHNFLSPSTVSNTPVSSLSLAVLLCYYKKSNSKNTQTCANDTHLFVFFGAQARVLVHYADVQLRRSLDDSFSLQRRDVVGNFRAVFSVVHQQEVQVLDVLDDKLQETIRQDVSGFLGCAVTDVRHVRQTFEFTSEARIDTFRSSPRRLLSLRKKGKKTGERVSLGRMRMNKIMPSAFAPRQGLRGIEMRGKIARSNT